MFLLSCLSLLLVHTPVPIHPAFISMLPLFFLFFLSIIFVRRATTSSTVLLGPYLFFLLFLSLIIFLPLIKLFYPYLQAIFLPVPYHSFPSFLSQTSCPFVLTITLYFFFIFWFSSCSIVSFHYFLLVVTCLLLP